ncbi:MAG TPA: hypothetical protein VGA16_03805 [Candidatus Limnocylindria bacterium]
MTALTRLSLDAKVIGALATANWLLLFANHTVVQVTRDAPLWQLFPGLWGAAWLLACGLLALTYPLRDHALGSRFRGRDRVLHLAGIVLLFVVVPTIAAIVLRETGKPYTYVHDGAIMVEEAARKLVNGQDPYVADYLDTSLFYWPMINNPALYHLTYFPVLFLVTVPFVVLFDRLGLVFDARYLYLPAYVATLLVAARVGWAASSPSRPPTLAAALSLTALVALDPQLFPFVVEGRNDFFVLLFMFAGLALLQRERRTLGVLAIAIAAASKLHAGPLLPFVLAYLFWKDAALPIRERLLGLARASWAGAIVLLAAFLPFLVDNAPALWDDVVAYNAGGAAWSYPVSGMGFSALLRTIGVISYPQQEFPFAIFQIAAAVPLAIWSMRRLRREPDVATMLTGYTITLLAFLFFGRYFHGNHLGFILALAAPIPFLRPELVSGLRARLTRPRAAVPSLPSPGAAVIAPVTITGDHDQPGP